MFDIGNLKKFFKEWKYTIFAGILIVIAAFSVRIFELTRLPVFVDEAIYIRWSQIMANEPTLRFLPLSDGKQPLYMWILMIIIKEFSDPLFAGRFLSTLMGVGTTIGVGVLSYFLFHSKKTLLFAMFLWAISPFAVFFDRLALVDSTLTFFAVWTAVLILFLGTYKRLDISLITGFFIGGALLTKSPALFFLILLPTSLLFFKFKKNSNLRELMKSISLMGISAILGYAIYNVLRLGPNFHLIAIRNADYVYPLSHIIKSPFDPLKPHFHRSLEWIWLMGPSALFGLFTISLITNYQKFTRQLLFLIFWIFIPLMAGAAFAKVFTARYILYTLPFFIVFCSACLSKKSIIFSKLAWFFVIIFALQSMVFLRFLYTDISQAPLPTSERTGYLEEWTAGDGIKEISDYLKNEHLKDPGKQIVVGTEGYFGTLPDGLQMYMQGVPNVVVKGVGLYLNELPSDLVASKKSGNKTYLVINKSRLKTDPKSIGLHKISEYKKALRSKETHDYALYGPQEILYFFEIVSIDL